MAEHVHLSEYANMPHIIQQVQRHSENMLNAFST